MIRFVVGSLMCLAWGFATGEGEENPFTQAKIGDVATYTMRSKAADFVMEGKQTITVTGKDEKSVVLKVKATTNGGKVIPESEFRIDLTRPFNPVLPTGIRPGKETVIELVETGKETIKVSGTDIPAEWRHYRLSTKVKGESPMQYKVWLRKEMPPILKLVETLEFEGVQVTTTMELVEVRDKNRDK